MGVSFATNTVTVNGQAASRKGEYFRTELAVANSGPISQSITVAATGQGSVTGSMLVAKKVSKRCQSMIMYTLSG
jgi:hypothetical protein